MRIQRPIEPNEWLYQEENDNRLFLKFVCLPDKADEWAECTNEEKLAWEEAHKPEEPQAEVVV